MTYERDGRVARITLDRPERGNGITLEMPRELADCVERANLDPEVHVIALAGNGTRLLRRLRPLGLREHRDPQPRPRRGLGSGPRLPDDVAQRSWLHEPLLVREARDHEAPRLLRRRRHRYGAVLGPAGGRRRREDRLPAGAGVGRADDGALGPQARADAGQAAAAHRRLDLRAARPSTGASRPTGRRRPRSTSASRPCSSASPAADKPAGDAQASGQPDDHRPGAALDPGARRLSSTASPATRRRATTSPAARPRPASRRPCASATSRSATSGSPGTAARVRRS